MKYISLFLILIFTVTRVISEDKIKVSLYYESLCPDSRRFVINQLAPHYIDDQLVDIIDLQIVPFGKAWKIVNQTDGSFTFECQHGEQECWGNKLHSCVVDKYFENQSNRENKLKTVQLISCSFSADDWRTNVTNAVNKCYQSVFGRDFNEIYECAISRGNDLLDKMGNLTNQLDPQLNYVPWITFNNVRNTDSEFNFLQSVCNVTSCPKIEVGVYYETLCPDSRRFIINQFAPAYARVINLIDVQFVPFGFGDKIVNETDGSVSFECQHGEPECFGNILHACVIEKYFQNQDPSNNENKLKTVQFLNASFSSDDWRNNVTKAFDDAYRLVFNTDPQQIYSCAEERGLELLDKMRNETLKLNPKPNWIPWITFDGIRNAESEFNFLECVLNRESCQSSDHSTINSLAFTLIFVALTFFIKSLKSL